MTSRCLLSVSPSSTPVHSHHSPTLPSWPLPPNGPAAPGDPTAQDARPHPSGSSMGLCSPGPGRRASSKLVPARAQGVGRASPGHRTGPVSREEGHLGAQLNLSSLAAGTLVACHTPAHVCGVAQGPSQGLHPPRSQQPPAQSCSRGPGAPVSSPSCAQMPPQDWLGLVTEVPVKAGNSLALGGRLLSGSALAPRGEGQLQPWRRGRAEEGETPETPASAHDTPRGEHLLVHTQECVLTWGRSPGPGWGGLHRVRGHEPHVSMDQTRGREADVGQLLGAGNPMPLPTPPPRGATPLPFLCLLSPDSSNSGMGGGRAQRCI